jgi:hypothetical protein
MARQQHSSGVLEGRVTIGPACPVERQPVGAKPESCPAPPGAYADRKVLVFTPNRDSLVASVDVDSTGSYRVELKPGEYLVDVKRSGIETSKDLPRRVQIGAGRTVRVDLSIDTGIR